MEYKGTLEKQNRVWVYDNEFLEWLVEISCNYTGDYNLSKDLGIEYSAFKRIIERNNLTMNYKENKRSPDYKAIYQNYDWCYQHFVVEGMTLDEMAKEANTTKRTIEKWCREKHHIYGLLRRDTIKLNQIQKELVIASLIGDGHIDKRETQPLFIVSHAENQKDYLYWKYDLLKNLCNKEPLEIPPKDTAFGKKIYKKQRSYRLCTRIVNDLKPLREMSRYDIVKQLNEFQLSIFMLDDGSRDALWQICVAMFNQETKELFVKICEERFGLKCHICNCDNRYISFDANSSRSLDRIILDNIPNELDIIQYKIINNKKITKSVQCVYVICNGKKIGISNYYKARHHGTIGDNIRRYLLDHNIFFIQEDELKLLEKKVIKHD